MGKGQPKGIGFLISKVGSETIFTPEDFTEDQRMFADTARRFVDEEVYPNVEDLEHPDGDHTPMLELLKKAGEIGLLMIDVPEAYGGLGLDKTTSMLCSEILAPYGGFSVSYGAHVGIGTLPIVYFGTHEQKQKWLPKLASGELIAAYALTEPGAGSDAMSAKTTAMPSADGKSYVFTGSKMWITNAGFADVFIVFAQVDGDKFTGFVVDAKSDGIELGAEERKMGLKGSSTRAITFTDVTVPADNVLGQVGKGHKIAFNILNIGRFKLGVGVLGGSKYIIDFASKYANERRQFGRPLSHFGAIRQKLAKMAIKAFALESMSYRVAGYMDASIESIDVNDEDYTAKAMAAIEEFAVEDSIMKVFGSETFSFVADEGVQILGGYGYSEEYPAARMYRDARINRIFEGTNEINRMLIPGTILKRTMKGQLPLFATIQAVDKAIAAERDELPEGTGLARAAFLVEKAKALSVFATNQAIQKHMADLKSQQELLLLIADLVIACYALDSSVARAMQLEGAEPGADLKLDATMAVVGSTYPVVLATAETLLDHVTAGDAKRRAAADAAFDKLAYRAGIDVISLERKIADAIVEREVYPL